LKRLFVTGGHGFVGQWIQRLGPAIRDAHGVEIELPAVDFDLLDPAQVDRELARARPDAILHLAAQSNVPQSFRDPEATFRVNLIGTLRLLEGVRRAGLSPRFVLASSGDVYGEVPEGELPVTESRIPRPRNPYAVSKLAAEELCGQWSRTEGLQAIVARPFNHVGKGQSEAFALPAFAHQVADIKAGRREPFVDAGDIDVTRDFLHVADVVEAYLVLLEKGVPGETYNVCSGIERRVGDLLARLVELAGIEAGVRTDAARLRPSPQRRMRGDNAKIRALGWQPAHPLEASLRDLLDEALLRNPHG
jgi:GDP-4-dehydro-6-deoxy-D-mannose reductase